MARKTNGKYKAKLKVNPFSRKETIEILNSLQDRFESGEKLTISRIIHDYVDGADKFDAGQWMLIKRVARGWMQALKARFRKLDQWFGCIERYDSEEGYYGLLDSQEHAVFASSRYFRFVKGLLGRASLAETEARTKGILPTGRRESLSVFKPKALKD